jgi:hypothetical protein
VAKITLTIEADQPDELRTILRIMGGAQHTYDDETRRQAALAFERMNPELDHQEMTDEQARMYEPDAGAGATQDAEPGERQARKRRTKAEMAADTAASSTQATAAPAPTSKASGSDPFGDQLKEVAAEAKTGLSLADVEAVGRQAFEKIGAPAMQAILMDKANGAKSFKQVEPQYFEAVHAALVEAAGE